MTSTETDDFLKCTVCEIAYHPSKSTSAMRRRYCTWLCERKELGFSIDALIKNPLTRHPNSDN